MTPRSSRQADLEGAGRRCRVRPRPRQHMPSRRWRSVAWSQCGRPSSCLRHAGQMRSEDDAAGVAGPVLDVEAGVVLRQVRIAAVAEDALDEIQVATPGCRARRSGSPCVFSADEAGHLRAHQRAQQQRDEAVRRAGWIRREGQQQRVLAAASARSARSSANAAFGTASLSAGIGRPPSATWNTPAVVRRSLAGLCRTPLRRR